MLSKIVSISYLKQNRLHRLTNNSTFFKGRPISGNSGGFPNLFPSVSFSKVHLILHDTNFLSSLVLMLDQKSHHCLVCEPGLCDD